MWAQFHGKNRTVLADEGKTSNENVQNALVHSAVFGVLGLEVIKFRFLTTYWFPRETGMSEHAGFSGSVVLPIARSGPKTTAASLIS
jgi:hypothetical protein